ncbi:uncharacterized protein [Paramormyrops kingsleyae]|uniref:uncharacterized protein isoform X2 n=1 Tax=Paramormyrops kingsleyae TaxID=1676925 RepID=UPI003B96DA5A
MEMVTAHRKHSPAQRDTGDQYWRSNMKMSYDTCINTNVDDNIYANKMDEDIYANADTIKANEAPKGTSIPIEQTLSRSQHSGSEPAGTRCYRLATVCLGILCLLLLLLITVLFVYYKGAFNDFEETFSMLAAKRDQLQGNYSSLKTNYNQLQTNYSIVKTERDQLASVAQRPRCPTGWISFNFKCYYVSDERKTWIDSQEDCRHKGADLLIINSLKEELIFSKDQRAWIGLTDKEHEGTWKWVDGTPLTTRAEASDGTPGIGEHRV